MLHVSSQYRRYTAVVVRTRAGQKYSKYSYSYLRSILVSYSYSYSNSKGWYSYSYSYSGNRYSYSYSYSWIEYLRFQMKYVYEKNCYVFMFFKDKVNNLCFIFDRFIYTFIRHIVV